MQKSGLQAADPLLISVRAADVPVVPEVPVLVIPSPMVLNPVVPSLVVKCSIACLQCFQLWSRPCGVFEPHTVLRLPQRSLQPMTPFLSFLSRLRQLNLSRLSFLARPRWLNPIPLSFLSPELPVMAKMVEPECP